MLTISYELFQAKCVLNHLLPFLVNLFLLGFNELQPLCVILSRLPEKGRKEIEEIVEEIKGRDRGERKINEIRRNRRNQIAGLAQL